MYSVPVWWKQLPECFVLLLLDHWQIAVRYGLAAEQTDSFNESHAS